jgi:hypothetical protein
MDDYTLIKGLKGRYGKDARCYVTLVKEHFDYRAFDLEKTNDCLREITQR